MIRNPAVEGRFYPANRDAIFQLISEIERQARYAEPDVLPGEVIGAVLPHAGHIYSGHQTLPFLKLLWKNNLLPDTFIILNPNHTGIGPPVSLDSSEYWRNSIGNIRVDQELNAYLPYPKENSAQMSEHSAEVILPFIQYYFEHESFKILPICMHDQSAETSKGIAGNIFESVKKLGRKVLVLASSDFSHFHSPEEGYHLDQMVLDRISQKDIQSLEQTVRKYRISVCGYGPIMALMAYSDLVNSEYRTMVLARGHSGEVHRSRDVVDYISVLFFH